MTKEAKPFHFKSFAVWHHRSAIKVGVDGVLIGCWALPHNKGKILDVGTGCGLIALIMAQRTPLALIDGIDIDSESAEEAAINAANSPWKERIVITQTRFDNFVSHHEECHQYGLVISNPPYFDSGLKNASSSREIARHQGDLSPAIILQKSHSLLVGNGSVAMILPTDIEEKTIEEAKLLGYSLARRCRVRGHESAPWKRVMMQWILAEDGEGNIIPEESELTLEIAHGIPSPEYRDLCKDFYLKF